MDDSHYATWKKSETQNTTHCTPPCIYKKIYKKQNYTDKGDFPGGPVAKTLHSQGRGPEFNPWLGN